VDCELYLLLRPIQWLSINVYRCPRPSATVANPHIVFSLGSKETYIQSHNPFELVEMRGRSVVGRSSIYTYFH